MTDEQRLERLERAIVELLERTAGSAGAVSAQRTPILAEIWQEQQEQNAPVPAK